MIGEAAAESVVAGLSKLVNTYVASDGPVQRLNDIRTMQLGPSEVLAVISLDFDDAASARDVEHVAAELETRVKRQHPQVVWIFVEAKSRGNYRLASVST